ncbi:hypothetical protein OS493_025351 [Desmophyllum pertusum]|uniref:TRADD-like N-terminal domain-containing protein n=1 Tax=Desmophyllum pertusum TaxID=174260 RepID=A0A9W9ZBP5_9CNID|nr:hypothetical protein OS493_025351 [Desmophyllum pertusum]
MKLYDFAELLEKVRPRSLRPALSPEQIEQLRGSSDRPTKYHSNVAVLVVKQIVGGLDNVESDNAEKIEAFFKDLNSRNEVTIIASPPSLQAVRRMEYQLLLLVAEAESTRRRLEIEIPRLREYLELEMQEQKEGKKRRSRRPQELSSELESIQQLEVSQRRELERLEKEVAALKERRETFKSQMEELQGEIEKAKTAISTAMDKWIHNQAKAVALASSVGNKLIGVLNIKTVFKVVAGGITVVSISEVLSRWSTFDQLVTAFNSCVLPAGTGLVQLTEGCVCLTVRAETLSALTTLWNLYQDGTLETRLYNFFVTDEIRELAGGEEVEVNVTIEEQEYEKACLEFINEAQEAASFGDGGRIRRNSDSAVYCSPKEELPLSKLERIETELKVCKERIAVMEKEIEIFSLDLEARSPEEKATFFKQTLEGRKARKSRESKEMDESTDKPEISQRLQAKLMDPGKYAFVEKYLEDIQERHSVTTEASDSGLGTHAAASELGMEEISETNKLRLKDLREDVIQDLNEKLRSDEATMEKFYQFFGLQKS